MFMCLSLSAFYQSAPINTFIDRQGGRGGERRRGGENIFNVLCHPELSVFYFHEASVSRCFGARTEQRKRKRCCLFGRSL